MVDISEVNIDNLLHSSQDIDDAVTDLEAAFEVFRNAAEEARNVMDGANVIHTGYVMKDLTDAVDNFQADELSVVAGRMKELVALADQIEYAE